MRLGNFWLTHVKPDLRKSFSHVRPKATGSIVDDRIAAFTSEKRR